MQIDYPRWPIPKNSINMKMMISQEPLVEIDPTLCQNVLLYAAFFIFLQFGYPRWPPFAITENSTECENDNISITPEWILTKFVSK